MEKPIRQQISEGRAASELMRVLDPYIEALRLKYTARWLNDASLTLEGREALYVKATLLSELLDEIEQVVQGGIVAEEIAKMKRVSRDAD